MPVDSLAFPLLVLFSSFLLVLALTPIVRRTLLKRLVLDIPNDRSSHAVPTPRGGGWALLLLLLPALIGAEILFDLNGRHGVLVAAVVLLSVISWRDDRLHVGAGVRLGLHLGAAFLGSLAFTSDQNLFGGLVPLWLDRACMIIGWAWFMNLYNFMDGIDGLTGSESVAIATGLCLVMAAAGIEDPYVHFLSLVLAGGCLGFLAHNWHPAKIFLGDVGSVPLGFLIGFCLLSLAVHGYATAALILPLYYLADSGITIVKRGVRGEKIWQAHRQHFYQKAAFGVGRHDKVVTYIIFANISLIAAAVLSISHEWAGLAVGAAVVAVLLGKLHRMGARPQPGRF